MEQDEASSRKTAVACRTCLVNISNTSQVYHLHSPRSGLLRQQLTDLLPDLNIFLTPSPVICKACFDVIEAAYNFKRRCLEIEKCIYVYVEKHSGLDVNLEEVERYSANNGTTHTDNSTLVAYNNDDVNFTEEANIIENDIDVMEFDYNEVENDVCSSHNEFLDNNVLDKPEVVEINKPEDKSVIVVESSSDEDEDYYKKTPYSCAKCLYRTGYKYNLSTHVCIQADEVLLRKDNKPGI